MNNKNKLPREAIAMRVTKELHNGNVVNLGIGIPSLCANYLPTDIDIYYQAETGLLGFKELYPKGKGDPNIMDASGNFPVIIPGLVFFDSIESFLLE